LRIASGILDGKQLQGRSGVVLDAAAQDEQPGVLTRAEWVRSVDAGSKAESKGLIVISRPTAV
jgi:hypothetical protein